MHRGLRGAGAPRGERGRPGALAAAQRRAGNRVSASFPRGVTRGEDPYGQVQLQGVRPWFSLEVEDNLPLLQRGLRPTALSGRSADGHGLLSSAG